MAFLSWHDRYRLGHAEIDAQHQRLFDVVNHFDDVIEMNMPAELGRILEDLLASATEHFRSEEAVMAQIGFPGRSGHCKMHEELLGQLRQMQARMKAGGDVSSKSVARFLVDWLTYHILRE
ncbi:MAG: bacteriohemerythrin, partial [Geothrix sp.]|nr:bacteriohemerythrin [Geothrix sp.]